MPAEAANVPVVLLYDAGSRQLLAARNVDLKFVPASMTKVMTAQVAFGLMARGALDPATIVTVPPHIAQEWNGKGTSLYLRADEAVSLETLIRAITTVSANDAAVTLAESQAGSIAHWADLMNAEAARLGMKSSHFASPNGWPDGGQTYVTAHDLARLADAMIAGHPDFYRDYFGQKSLTWNGVTQFNRDPTLGVVAGADGIKTGHTREAGFNFLGSAKRNGRRLVLIIGGAASEEARARASRAMLEWGFNAWDSPRIFAGGAVIGHAEVQGGTERSLPLRSAKPVYFTIPHGGKVRPSLVLHYRGPLVAPIAKGQQVASLSVRVDGREVASLPLEAGLSVSRAGPLDRLRNGLYGLLP